MEDPYRAMRTRDIVGGLLLVMAVLVLFSLLPEQARGAERDWVFDMVEHGHWSVGRVIATCDGPNRVYVVRGDTGVALTVVPNGCSQ